MGSKQRFFYESAGSLDAAGQKHKNARAAKSLDSEVFKWGAVVSKLIAHGHSWQDISNVYTMGQIKLFYKEAKIASIEQKTDGIEQAFIGAQGAQESIMKIIDSAKSIREQLEV